MTTSTDETAIRKLVRSSLLRLLGDDDSRGKPQPWSRPARRIIDADSLTDVPDGSRLDLPASALITPLAREVALERKITLANGPDQPQVTGPAQRSVALAADHGGFQLKEALKETVASLGWEVVDCGTFSTDSVDYPDYAYAAARLVADGRVRWAIIVDGAGIGSCMTANKVPGVRAAMCYDQASAANSREHNHANVLTLGAGLIGPSLAKQIVQVWLETPFGPDRHARRVDKIMEIERRFAKR